MSNRNNIKPKKVINVKNSKENANNENLFDLSLVNLQPSRELLDFYRRKVSELTSDHDGLIRRLEQLNETCISGHTLTWNVKQCEEEIVDLQKALSDMQIYLFKEREQVLRLYAENDRLKIRELNDRKKVQHLLQLSGLTQSEVTYFIKDPPSKAVVQPNHAVTLVTSDGFTTSVGSSKKAGVSSKNSNNNSSKVETVSVLEHESLKRDLDSFKLQIQALQSQLEEQTKLYKEQSEALMEDRRIKQEESETQRTRDQEKIQTLSEKLKRTQELLYENTKDFLSQRGQYRENEKSWIAEKDSLLRRLQSKESGRPEPQWEPSGDTLGLQERAWAEVSGQAAAKRDEQHKASIKNLEYQLDQAQKLSEMYREQVIEMENELSQIREQEGATRDMYRKRSGQIGDRLQTMCQRYRALERRRNLEVQGFQTDIAALRKKLAALERQLYSMRRQMPYW